MAQRRTKRAWWRCSITPIACGGILTAAVVAHGCADEVARPLQVNDAVSPAAVGDPCYPADEANPAFPGFGVKLLNLEDQFPACQSGLCIVNHFQGRVDCPLGQPAPT